MKEISNQAIAVLVVVSIVVSGVGMILAMSKLSEFDEMGLTGFAVVKNATGHGRANVTVPTRVYIEVLDGIIEFGTMDVGDNNNSQSISDYFTVENDGNVEIDIEAFAEQSIFTTGVNCSTVPNDCYQIACATNQSGFCNLTYRNIQANASSAQFIMTNMDFRAQWDEIQIGVNITIPEDELAGDKSGVITIAATQS